jgi:hypothetical protein
VTLPYDEDGDENDDNEEDEEEEEMTAWVLDSFRHLLLFLVISNTN